MNTIAWLILIAALTPMVATGLAKAGGSGFDNNDPRPWLAKQTGWRARVNAAQTNLFEGLPLFFAAVLFALYNRVDTGHLATLMVAWIVLRLAYIGAYAWGKGSLRSLLWAGAIGFDIAILFTAV